MDVSFYRQQKRKQMISDIDIKQSNMIEINGRNHFRKHWKGLFQEMTLDENCEWQEGPPQDPLKDLR